MRITGGDTKAAGLRAGSVAIKAGTGFSANAKEGGYGGDVSVTAGYSFGLDEAVNVGGAVTVTAGTYCCHASLKSTQLHSTPFKYTQIYSNLAYFLPLSRPTQPPLKFSYHCHDTPKYIQILFLPTTVNPHSGTAAAATGGSISMATGFSTGSSSGSFSIKTANAGLKGTGGSFVVKTGGSTMGE